MVCIREILFASDLSAASDQAFLQARLLAERFRARLTLYHAAEVPDHRYAHWAFDSENQIWGHAEGVAREALTRRAEGLTVEPRVIVERKASVPRGLLEVIRRLQPDLTVMATHGREGLGHLLQGSVTEQVVLHTFHSVLCVRAAEIHDIAPAPYRRILVPTDLSLGSRLAFSMAAYVARSFDAQVTALHVVPNKSFASPPHAPHGTGSPTEAALWKFFQDDFFGVPVTAQVQMGCAWERIVETAKTLKADAIVMSTRGHNTLADRVVGNTAERVVRHTPCPVLIA